MRERWKERGREAEIEREMELWIVFWRQFVLRMPLKTMNVLIRFAASPVEWSCDVY